MSDLNNLPLVSAIITTHNRKNLLKRAIDSVLSQTYKNIELIVVDDASSDDTVEFCKNYGVKCISISKEESRGGNYARNKGILSSNGKYIALLDDDDYWLPEKTTRQVDLLENSDSKVVCCSHRIEYIDKNGDISFKDAIKNSPQLYEGDLSKRILYQITLLTSGSMIDRAILDKVGLFDENLGFWQEYELSIRMAQESTFSFINEPLFVYRSNPFDTNRLTNKYFKWCNSVNYIYKKHKRLYKTLSFKEKLLCKLLKHRDGLQRAKNADLEFQAKIRRNKIIFYTYLYLIINRIWKNR